VRAARARRTNSRGSRATRMSRTSAPHAFAASPWRGTRARLSCSACSPPPPRNPGRRCRSMRRSACAYSGLASRIPAPRIRRPRRGRRGWARPPRRADASARRARPRSRLRGGSDRLRRCGERGRTTPPRLSSLPRGSFSRVRANASCRTSSASGGVPSSARGTRATTGDFPQLWKSGRGVARPGVERARPCRERDEFGQPGSRPRTPRAATAGGDRTGRSRGRATRGERSRRSAWQLRSATGSGSSTMRFIPTG
jgi:hypothetical protein